MIKMENVKKTYPAFDFQLSLEIPKGRITGLVGKNGTDRKTDIRDVRRWIYCHRGNCIPQ